MPEVSKFKQDNTLEDRKNETTKIMKKYDDRIPIIIERSARTDLPDVEKNKYLVPDNLTVGQFIFTALRTRLKIDNSKALFVFIDDVIPPTSASLKEIYDEHKDEDGFLYMTYAGENTFGCKKTKKDINNIYTFNMYPDNYEPIGYANITKIEEERQKEQALCNAIYKLNTTY